MQVKHMPFIPAFGFETSSHNAGKFVKTQIEETILEKRGFCGIDTSIKKCKEEVDNLKEKLKEKQIGLKIKKWNKLQGKSTKEEIENIKAQIKKVKEEGTKKFEELQQLKALKKEKLEAQKLNLEESNHVVWKTHNVVKVLEYFPMIGSFFGLVRLANTLLSTKKQCPNKSAHITRAVLAIFCVGFVAAPLDIFYSLSSKKGN